MFNCALQCAKVFQICFSSFHLDIYFLHKTLPRLIIMDHGFMVSKLMNVRDTQGETGRNLHHLGHNRENPPHHRHDDDDDGGGMSKRSLLSGGRNAIIDTWAHNTSHCPQLGSTALLLAPCVDRKTFLEAWRVLLYQLY